jgi:phosphatidylserine synthase
MVEFYPNCLADYDSMLAEKNYWFAGFQVLFNAEVIKVCLILLRIFQALHLLVSVSFFILKCFRDSDGNPEFQ